MDEDIEFLRNFIEYDRYRIAELSDSLPNLMSIIGRLLRSHAAGPFSVVYRDENDLKYEFIQLLDGNNFEVDYGSTRIGVVFIGQITPLYPETTATVESKIELTEYILDEPEIINPPHRGLRAKMPLINDITFDGRPLSELIKPPQCRKE